MERRVDGSLARSTYHKKTWSGQYLHFKSFAPIAYKRGLVRTLFDRARQIATNDKIDKDTTVLYETLLDNGYPAKFVDKYARQRGEKHALLTVPRKSVFLCLLYKGDDVSILIKRRLNAAVNRTYHAAKLVFIEQSNRVPMPLRKGPIPAAAN
ncbi:unnamed protein product [Echinostoma caproni]|uniref:Transposase n=1 Tax=Echinostoma caproni TaxID=27848 RepID=A0A183B892_9TREM|nr:unnamed protein product [Echinostoma caproni]